MDPAGFEPASATLTECCVLLTPPALKELGPRRRKWQGHSSRLVQPVPNWDKRCGGVKGPPCRTERGDKDGATARFLHVSVLRSIHFSHNQNHTSKPQPSLPLPAPRLEHVGFVQPSDGQTLHGADEILADFK